MFRVQGKSNEGTTWRERQVSIARFSSISVFWGALGGMKLEKWSCWLVVAVSLDIADNDSSNIAEGSELLS